MKQYAGAATAVAILVIAIVSFTSYTVTFTAAGGDTLTIIVVDDAGAAIPGATLELHDMTLGQPTAGPFDPSSPLAKGAATVDERGTLTLDVPRWEVMQEMVSTPILKVEIDASGWYEVRVLAPGYETAAFRLDEAMSGSPVPASADGEPAANEINGVVHRVVLERAPSP